MTIYRLDNQRANYKGHWAAATSYALGDRVLAESTNTGNPRKYVFECTTAGTSQNPGPPTWDVTTPDTSTTTDNTVVWTCRIPDDWDNAHARIDWLTLLSTAGDTIYVDDSDSESYAASITIQGSTTFGNPLKIICVDKATDTISSGALISNTSYFIYLQGVAYSFGVSYTCPTLWLYQTSTLGSWTIESATLTLTSTGYVTLLGNSLKSLFLKNVNLTINSLGAYVSAYGGNKIIWESGTLTAASGLTNLFKAAGSASDPLLMVVRDVNLSAIGSGALVNVGTININIDFERCKLSATGTITTGSWSVPGSSKVRCHHCSSATNVIEFYESSYEGTVEDETTTVRSGGLATSWKMVSSANVKEYIQSLISPPMSIWNSSTGSSKTITVYIYNATADLDDDEVWVEVEYPANDGGKGLIVFDRAGCGGSYNTRDPLATPAAQTDDTSTWNGSSTYAQKLQVAFTPALAGPITARVYLAKPSTTIYVDPKVYIT